MKPRGGLHHAVSTYLLPFCSTGEATRWCFGQPHVHALSHVVIVRVQVVTRIGEKYPEVELSHMYVDNAAMQLIRQPKAFDVIVTGNIFGDILSDAGAMLTGSLGMLPSASISNDGPGIFEPVHGSAPDIAGEDKANPLAMVLSAAMMCRYGLGRSEIAGILEDAVNYVLDEGYRTGDIMSDGCKQVSCSEIGDILLKYVESS